MSSVFPEESDPENSLYHVTPAENVPSIMEEGLRVDPPETTPWERGSANRGVHFAQGLSDAMKWAQQISNAHSENESRLAEEGGYPDPQYTPQLALLRLTNPAAVKLRASRAADVNLGEHISEEDVPASNIEHRGNFFAPYTEE